MRRLAEDEAGLLGAAVLAGVGGGVFNSIDDGVDGMVRTLENYEPDPGRHREYQACLEKFSRLYQKLYG